MMKPELHRGGEPREPHRSDNANSSMPNDAASRIRRSQGREAVPNRRAALDGPAFEMPPADLLEQGLEAECYAAMANAANKELDRRMASFSDDLALIRPAASHSVGIRKQPFSRRLSGRYQLMLGLLAGMIATGGAALQWAFDPARNLEGKIVANGNEQSRNWSLQGPIVLDIPGGDGQGGEE
jgi:hypothetical protein